MAILKVAARRPEMFGSLRRPNARPQLFKGGRRIANGRGLCRPVASEIRSSPSLISGGDIGLTAAFGARAGSTVPPSARRIDEQQKE